MRVNVAPRHKILCRLICVDDAGIFSCNSVDGL